MAMIEKEMQETLAVVREIKDRLRLSEKFDSVEVSRTSAGKYTWSVKAYRQSPQDALAAVEVVEAELKKKYGSEGMQ